MEIEVERCPPLQAQAADRIEPAAHQLRVAGRVDAATVFGEERSLGDHVQPGEEGQPLVEDRAHDVAVACVAEELQGQQRPHGTAGRDHLRSGEAAACQDRVQVGGDQVGQEEEQAAELGVERAAGPSRVDGRRRHRPRQDAGRSGRSSSPRRGSLAKPSSLKIAATAAGLSDSPSRAKARLMSWTERFCLRRATTCSPQPFLLAGRPALGRGERRIRARAGCGTGGRGRGSSPAYSRSERPPRTTGGPRRRRPGGPRIVGGWSWRAPGTGGPVLGDLWNYRPCCHGVILSLVAVVDSLMDCGESLDFRQNRSSRIESASVPCLS